MSTTNEILNPVPTTVKWTKDEIAKIKTVLPAVCQEKPRQRPCWWVSEAMQRTLVEGRWRNIWCDYAIPLELKQFLVKTKPEMQALIDTEINISEYTDLADLLFERYLDTPFQDLAGVYNRLFPQFPELKLTDASAPQHINTKVQAIVMHRLHDLLHPKPIPEPPAEPVDLTKFSPVELLAAYHKVLLKELIGSRPPNGGDSKQEARILEKVEARLKQQSDAIVLAIAAATKQLNESEEKLWKTIPDIVNLAKDDLQVAVPDTLVVEAVTGYGLPNNGGALRKLDIAVRPEETQIKIIVIDHVFTKHSTENEQKWAEACPSKFKFKFVYLSRGRYYRYRLSTRTTVLC